MVKKSQHGFIKQSVAADLLLKSHMMGKSKPFVDGSGFVLARTVEPMRSSSCEADRCAMLCRSADSVG